MMTLFLGHSLKDMGFKNYYAVLGVAPSATQEDIKKKFRRLALQYHPDKNPDNDWVVTRFRDIQEAYQVLSDPVNRQSYNREWQLQFPNASTGPVQTYTPEALLLDLDRLYKQVSAMDPFRINKQWVAAELSNLLHADAIKMVRFYSNPTLTAQITRQVLALLTWLPPAALKIIQASLWELAAGDESLQSSIKHARQSLLYKNWWNRYAPLVALLIALLASFLIFLVSR